MSLDDVEYYRRRAEQERELADSADSVEAARAHGELARFYEGLVKRADYLPRSRVPNGNLNGVQGEGFPG